MAKLVLSLLVGILALNAVALGALAVAVAIEARRRAREIRDLEKLWRTEEFSPRSERAVVTLVRANLPTRAARRRPTASRAVALLTLGAIVCGSGTALASPRARQAVSSAFVAITHGLTFDHRHPEEVAAAESPPPSRQPAVLVPVVPRATGPAANTEAPRHASPSPQPAASPAGAADAPVALPPPEGVTAVAPSASEVDVTWTGVAGANSYRVERSTDGVSDWTTVADLGSDTVTLPDQALAADTTYYYRVYAIGRERMSSASDVASATTLVAPPPAPSVTVTATSSEIDLSWTDVAGETGYRIERSTDGTDWAQIGTTGADVTMYADGGLPSGSTFSYRVFATNAGGDSPPSDVVSAQTLAQAPAQQATDTQGPAAAPSEVAQPLARTRATRETRSR